jgi:hypothetical protein
MKHLITCSNDAEAGLLHSMLTSAGIHAHVRDSRADIAGVHRAQLFVPDDQHEQATALLATQRRTEPVSTIASPHPATGFPFLGIMGLSAIVWCLAYVITAATSIGMGASRESGTADAVLLFVYGGGLAVLWGLFVGALIALVCLIAKITWTKLKA